MSSLSESKDLRRHHNLNDGLDTAPFFQGFPSVHTIDTLGLCYVKPCLGPEVGSQA